MNSPTSLVGSAVRTQRRQMVREADPTLYLVLGYLRQRGLLR